jgi:hypothetical protein
LKEQIQVLNYELETKNKEIETSKNDYQNTVNSNVQNVYFLRKQIDSLNNVQSKNIIEIERLKNLNFIYSSDLIRTGNDLTNQYQNVNELTNAIKSQNQIGLEEKNVWQAQFNSLKQKLEVLEKENTCLKAQIITSR